MQSVEADTEEPTRDRSAPVRLVGFGIVTPLLSAMVALMLAYGISILLSATVYEGGSDSDDGAGLLVLVVFLLVWLAVSLVVAPLVGWLLARTTAVGGRSVATLAFLFGWWLPSAFVVGAGGVWFGYRSGLEIAGGAMGVVAAVALLATAPLVHDRNPRALRLVWSVAGAFAFVFLLLVIVLEPAHRRSLYADAGPPLGLIDEAELSTVLPGWRVSGYVDGSRDGDWPFARAMVLTDNGVELELSFSPSTFLCTRDRDSCVSLDPLDDGAEVEVWHDSAQCGQPRQPSRVNVGAVRPSGRWSISVGNMCEPPEKPTADELRLLLTTVDPVSVGDWVAGT